MNRQLLFLLGAVLVSVLSSHRDVSQDHTSDRKLAFDAVPTKYKDSNEEKEDKSDEKNAEDEEDEDQSSSSEAELKDKNDDNKMDESILLVAPQNFSCPSVETDLVTGTSADTLSPEDIDIIAAMGDGLSTGFGLWQQLPLEFRGTVFSIGGDASLEDLVTIPNILRKFNAKLSGASHGMGTREQLPHSQLNVAATSAPTSALLSQAEELSRRLALRNVDLNDYWVLIVVTIGSEELCATCAEPNTDVIEQSLTFLNQNIPKALVVMIGPLDFRSHNVTTSTPFRNRCPCFKQKSEDELDKIYEVWKRTLLDVEQNFNNDSKFGVLTVPFLSLTNLSPMAVDDIFLPSNISFNRQGHNYAAKWLWNRLMTGSRNEMSSRSTHDELVCPSKNCPYFRTIGNANKCNTLKNSDITTPTSTYTTTISDKLAPKIDRRKRKSTMLYLVALVVVSIAFCVVLCVGTILYNLSKHQVKGRFEIVPEGV